MEISEHEDNSLECADRNEADNESSGELTEPHPGLRGDSGGRTAAAAGASDETDRGEHADKRIKVN